MYSNFSRSRREFNRFQFLFYIALFFFAVIVGKLAWLQIIHAEEYRALADEQNSRGVVLPARRGNIYAKDHRTGELFPLAQNSTTYTIFADPALIESGTETTVVEQLLPFLFVETDEEEIEISTENEEGELAVTIDPKTELQNKLIDQLVTKEVVRRELHSVSPEELQIITDSHLMGVAVVGQIVTINPNLVVDPETTATQLSTVLEANYTDIYPLLLPRKVRYTRLATRVAPAVRDEIITLGIRGIGSIAEYRRVYPENNLASQVIGFFNHDERGAYGIEGALDSKLRGKNGLRQTQQDPFGRQITVGEVLIENAEDGNSLVLTIDRSIQSLVEEELAKVVDYQRADSGQAIIMDPATGAILALAHYPTFDPNNYGAVYSTEELIKKERTKKWVDDRGVVQKEIETWWETEDGIRSIEEWGVEYIVRKGYRYPVFTEYLETESIRKSIYENRLGEGVFALKAANEPYEPGSVFKPIVMASALDSGEVTPLTRSPYSGPVVLDEINYRTKKPIVIKNAEGKYHGQETMSEVIAHSSNIGMTFVAQQLGRATFYDYLKKFGFGERTEVEIEGEDAGTIENYTKWSDSELVTKGFGQGLTVNLFQMAAGYSALANGGLLMKPYIIDEEILPNGVRIKTEPETIRRVIDEETSREISEILVNSVRNGYAAVGGVEGYFIAGKTGTSQTYLHGRALSSVGTTLASFGGYAPAADPRYVFLVKIDRPRVSEWGAAVAAPIFQKVSETLLTNYFAIPPES